MCSAVLVYDRKARLNFNIMHYYYYVLHKRHSIEQDTDVLLYPPVMTERSSGCRELRYSKAIAFTHVFCPSSSNSNFAQFNTVAVL